ncbi:MAG: hypothetical protein ABIH50_07640 [bacterium]
MVKRSTVMFLFLALMAQLVMAQMSEQKKVEAYLGQLKNKLATAQKAQDSKRILKLKQLIDQTKVRLNTIAGSSSEDNDKIADLKDETNKALTELKSQIDKVKKDNGDAKIGGVVFFRWQKYTQNGTATTPNNFDVDRAYIDIKKKLDWGASSRVTLDISRINGAAKQTLFDYLKYAYVEMPLNVSGLQVVPWEMTAKAGLQHTVWIDWADKALGLRWIAKSLLDNEGVMSSSDFGVGAIGKVSLAGLPAVEYHATVLNGSGYSTNESDSEKALAMRVNSVAYDAGENGKVIVGAMLNVESLNTSFDLGGSNKQAALELIYRHDLGTAKFEYITGSKSSKKINGYSLGGVLNLSSVMAGLERYKVFARLDNYDPNTSRANDEKNKTFYGVTYDWGKDVKLAADMQTSQTGSGATTSIFYLHSQISF